MVKRPKRSSIAYAITTMIAMCWGVFGVIDLYAKEWGPLVIDVVMCYVAIGWANDERSKD